MHGGDGAFFGISRSQGRLGRVGFRGAVSNFRRVFGHHDRRVRDDLASPHDYAPSSRASDLAGDLIGGFAGGFVARRYSAAVACGSAACCRRSPILSFSWLAIGASTNGRWHSRLRRENSPAPSHRDFRRVLSALCQNPLTPQPNTRC